MDSVVEAIEAFESMASRLSPPQIQTHARCFGMDRFKAEIGAFVEEKLADYRSLSPQPTYR